MCSRVGMFVWVCSCGYVRVGMFVRECSCGYVRVGMFVSVCSCGYVRAGSVSKISDKCYATSGGHDSQVAARTLHGRRTKSSRNQRRANDVS